MNIAVKNILSKGGFKSKIHIPYSLGHHWPTFEWTWDKWTLTAAAVELFLHLPEIYFTIWKDGKQSWVLQILSICEQNLWREVWANIILPELKSPWLCCLWKLKATHWLWNRRQGKGAWEWAARDHMHSALGRKRTPQWTWVKDSRNAHQWVVTCAPCRLLLRAFRLFSEVKRDTIVIRLCKVYWSQHWET